MNPPVLRYALLSGVAYFCCMALLHYSGIRLPLLFVYYDIPFYAYQDRIIAFAVVGYAALFYTAARHRVVVPAALFTLGVTVLGLASINLSEALTSLLALNTEHRNLLPSRPKAVIGSSSGRTFLKYKE